MRVDVSKRSFHLSLFFSIIFYFFSCDRLVLASEVGLSPALTAKIQDLLIDVSKNREMLRNWKGEITFLHRETDESGIQTCDRLVEVLFTQNFVFKKLICTYKEKKINVPDAWEVSPYLAMGGILHTDGHDYDYFSNLPIKRDGRPFVFDDFEKDFITGLLVIQKSDTVPHRSSSLGTRFLPNSLAEFAGRNAEWELKGYFEFIKGGNSTDKTTYREEGNLVHFIDRFNDDYSILTFDKSKGAMLVKIENQMGVSGTSHWKFIPQLVSGVWVPHRLIHERTHGNGKKDYYEINWSNITVNGSENEKDYSLLALGVRQGDHVSDLMTTTRYYIQDDSLPASLIEEFMKKKSTSIKSGTIVRYVFICTGSLMVLLAIGLKIYRWWRKKVGVAA